jgi:hypothetical protein
MPGWWAAVDHSKMRPEVQASIADSRLPDWDASEEEVDRRGNQLTAISGPVTGEEARSLSTCFGPDDCYGVAWTLLHLIETGPNPVLTTQPAPEANEWQHRLWARAVNGDLVPGV